jgi:hypothetical protein
MILGPILRRSRSRRLVGVRPRNERLLANLAMIAIGVLAWGGLAAFLLYWFGVI